MMSPGIRPNPVLLPTTILKQGIAIHCTRTLSSVRRNSRAIWNWFNRGIQHVDASDVADPEPSRFPLATCHGSWFSRWMISWRICVRSQTATVCSPWLLRNPCGLKLCLRFLYAPRWWSVANEFEALPITKSIIRCTEGKWGRNGVIYEECRWSGSS